MLRMALQFRTAFIAPSSRVFGRGGLVIDPKDRKQLYTSIFVDLFSVLPLPQIAVWRFLHRSEASDVLGTKRALVIIVFLQYIPRLQTVLLWYLLAIERKDTCWDIACRENED